MEQKEINALLKQRDILINRGGKSKKIDQIQEQIMTEIKSNFNKYEVDFILETLTCFGYAPCVMYDDNGMFAVSSDGMQSVVTGRQRINGAITVFVEKKQWKKTIREAVKHFVTED